MRHERFKERDWTVKIGGPNRVGYTHDAIRGADGTVYMERWILWFWFFTLRVHKFMRPDVDDCMHDHPWWFITFPLGTYVEEVPHWYRAGWPGISTWSTGGLTRQLFVDRFRFHFRPAEYRHRVIYCKPPTYTLVLTGSLGRMWGFWPEPDRFVPFREFLARDPIAGDES